MLVFRGASLNYLDALILLTLSCPKALITRDSGVLWRAERAEQAERRALNPYSPTLSTPKL